MARFDVLVDFAYEFQVIQQEIDQFEILVVPSKLFNNSITEIIRRLITDEFPNTSNRAKKLAGDRNVLSVAMA